MAICALRYSLNCNIGILVLPVDIWNEVQANQLAGVCYQQGVDAAIDLMRGQGPGAVSHSQRWVE